MFEPHLSPLDYAELSGSDQAALLEEATQLGLLQDEDPSLLWDRAMGRDYRRRLHLYKDWVVLQQALPSGIWARGARERARAEIISLTPAEVRAVSLELESVATADVGERLRGLVGEDPFEVTRLLDRLEGLKAFLRRSASEGAALVALFE